MVEFIDNTDIEHIFIISQCYLSAVTYGHDQKP